MPGSPQVLGASPGGSLASAEIRAAILEELGPELVDLIRKIEQRRTDRSAVREEHPVPVSDRGISDVVVEHHPLRKVVSGQVVFHQAVKTIAKGFRHVASFLDRLAGVK